MCTLCVAKKLMRLEKDLYTRTKSENQFHDTNIIIMMNNKTEV